MCLTPCLLCSVDTCSCRRRNLLRVSKRWKTFLESHPSVWQDLDLSTIRKKIRFSAVKACVRRSDGLMKKATLRGLDAFENSALEYILARCKGLTFLDIRCTMRDEMLQREPFSKAIATASNLKTLILSHDGGIGLEMVDSLLSACSPLVHFELHRVYENRLVPSPPLWQADLSQLRVLTLHAAEEATYQSGNLNFVGAPCCKTPCIGLPADHPGHFGLESPET